MTTYKVAVEYRSWGLVDVEAENKDHLMKKLKDRDFLEQLPLPDDPEYIDGTTEVDFSSVEDYN